MKKTLKFIEKAKKIHGDKYDYSNTIYTESKNKVNIICPIHGIFEQRASGHLSGYGCQKCSADKQRLGCDEFIKRANEKHNNKYDYSLVEYKTYNDNVTIICPIHGKFEQSPAHHLNGIGCLECSFIHRRIGTEKFIRKANEVHGNKYDYSKVEYKKAIIKVEIICPKHGEFKQTPHNHLKGNGCPYCRESKGEEKIRMCLENNNIKYFQEYKFSNCKDVKSLLFDFYLPDYNTCIEFNGIQHYKSIEYFGGKNALKKQQKKDKIKELFCKKNNINLIIVKYNEKLEKKIINFINKCKNG
ncbi:MAG TPA: hypothetical protein P5241_01505 [Candidatus Paceibacterota bacterium]|nr:hypothetical protein [Candidatus Paceibacterota bacterium]